MQKASIDGARRLSKMLSCRLPNSLRRMSFQPSHHAGCRRDLVYAASATGSLYRSPLAIIAQAIRAILLASAMAATFVGRRASNADHKPGQRPQPADVALEPRLAYRRSPARAMRVLEPFVAKNARLRKRALRAARLSRPLLRGKLCPFYWHK